jgi:hypothetical protein
MRQLLAALGANAKRINDHKYIAICPVHGGNKNHALKIKQTGDGSVIAHCFSCGVNGLDLYRHLGLDLDELFGGKKLDNKRCMPAHIAKEHAIDKMCISVHESDIKAERVVTLADKRRYRLALARTKGAEEKFYT